MRKLGIVLAALALIGALVAFLSPAPEAQRRGQRRADEPPLTVEEYTPRSTLVVDEHPVLRAKYPVIDIHSHHRSPSESRWAEIVSEMDALNLQVLVNLSGGSGSSLQRGITTIKESPVPDRMVFFANLSFGRGVYPGFGEEAAAQLERTWLRGPLASSSSRTSGSTSGIRMARGFRSTIPSSTRCLRCVPG